MSMIYISLYIDCIENTIYFTMQINYCEAEQQCICITWMIENVK